MTESCLRIPSAALHKLAVALFERSDTSKQHADLMARLLVETDLRGVFSHGTKQIPGYVRMMREGRVNPRPTVRVVRQTQTTQVTRRRRRHGAPPLLPGHSLGGKARQRVWHRGGDHLQPLPLWRGRQVHPHRPGARLYRPGRLFPPLAARPEELGPGCQRGARPSA